MTSPDTPPPTTRRSRRGLIVGGAVIVLIAFAVWAAYWIQTADRRRAEALYEMAYGGDSRRRMTDAEFDEALALASSADWETRHHALTAAANRRYERQRPGSPDPRGERIEEVALRLLDSSDPRDQADALNALWLTGRTGQLERARTFLTSPDPEVQRAAAGAVSHFEARLAPPGPAFAPPPK